MQRFSCRKVVGIVQQKQRQLIQGLCRCYHERVVNHYNKPRNVGYFDKTDPTVRTSLVCPPICGDAMKLQIKVDDSGRSWMLVSRLLVVDLPSLLPPLLLNG